MNKIWLSAFFWRNTEEVQKALRIDSEHTAARAWQAHGARETYTLLCKLGLDETEKIDNQKLHIFYKPVYLCGYLHGIKKAAVVEDELIKYQMYANQYEKLLEEYEDLNEKQDDLKGRTMQERIKECHAAGMSYGKIAKFVGCSKTTAYKYAKKENSTYLAEDSQQ